MENEFVTPEQQFANDQNWLAEMSAAMQGAGGIQLPFAALNIWATSGKKNLKQVGGVAYHGGWSADAEQFEDMQLTGAPNFIKVDRSGDSGDYTVYETRAVHIAPIALRESWLSKDGKSRRAKYDSDHTRSHTQILSLLGVPVLGDGGKVTGITYIAPCVIGAKGIGMGGTLKSAIALWKEAIDQTRKSMTDHAAYPPSAWWHLIGTRGDAVFEEVGKSVKNTITPLKALLPAELDQITAKVIEARYIGDDNLRLAYGLMKQAAEWLKAWNAPSVSDYAPEVTESID